MIDMISRVSIKKKIEAIATAKEKKRSLFLELFLFSISVGYVGVIKLREILYKKYFLKSKSLPCPVISIGNITVGGTGKTPMTIYIAELLKNLGYNVAIISRGYKGKAEKTGGVVCDGERICLEPDQAGDEPFMMAKRLKSVPIIVGKNRFKSGILAVKEFNPDVVLLDDGFQHLKLHRDVDLMLLDSKEPFGNTYLFPRGTLRETASAMERGDAVILTRSDVGKSESIDQIKNIVPEKPIFHSFHVPYIYKIVTGSNRQSKDRFKVSSGFGFEVFNNTSAVAFSGIARNDDFLQTIESFNCEIRGFSRFPDHHEYTDRELDTIVKSALDLSVDFIFTTEKDCTRIAHKINWPIDVAVIGIEISFRENELAFKSFIKNRLKELIKRREL
jgi:tetraacyldisaccharide 4'-kinase